MNTETKKNKISGDLTEGTPWKQIVMFSLPLLLGNVLQTLYNTVDSIVVGRFVGDGALAAVGVSFPVMMVMVSLALGIGMGGSILIAQFFGAREYEKLGRTIITTFITFLAIGVLVTILGSVLAAPILRLMNTPKTIFEQAVIYLRIIFLGIITLMLYNMTSGVLRGIGDSVTPLISLGIAAAANVALDLLFVVAFQMGVAGAAYATITAQGLSAAFNFIVINRKADYMRITARRMKSFDRTILKEILRLGLPTALYQAILSSGTMVVQSVINSYGEAVVAAATMVMKVDALCIMPAQSLGLAMTTYTGQNLGAQRMDRVNKGIHDGFKIMFGVAAAVTVILVIFGRYAMLLFTDDPAIVDMATDLQLILCKGYFFMFALNFLSGVLRGAGHAMAPTIALICAFVVFRIPLAYILCYAVMDSHRGAWYAQFISWGANVTVLTIYYFKVQWRESAMERIKKKVLSGQIAQSKAAVEDCN